MRNYKSGPNYDSAKFRKNNREAELKKLQDDLRKAKAMEREEAKAAKASAPKPHKPTASEKAAAKAAAERAAREEAERQQYFELRNRLEDEVRRGNDPELFRATIESTGNNFNQMRDYVQDRIKKEAAKTLVKLIKANPNESAYSLYSRVGAEINLAHVATRSELMMEALKNIIMGFGLFGNKRALRLAAEGAGLTSEQADTIAFSLRFRAWRIWAWLLCAIMLCKAIVGDWEYTTLVGVGLAFNWLILYFVVMVIARLRWNRRLSAMKGGSMPGLAGKIASMGENGRKVRMGIVAAFAVVFLAVCGALMAWGNSRSNNPVKSSQLAYDHAFEAAMKKGDRDQAFLLLMSNSYKCYGGKLITAYLEADQPDSALIVVDRTGGDKEKVRRYYSDRERYAEAETLLSTPNDVCYYITDVITPMLQDGRKKDAKAFKKQRMKLIDRHDPDYKRIDKQLDDLIAKYK